MFNTAPRNPSALCHSTGKEILPSFFHPFPEQMSNILPPALQRVLQPIHSRGGNAVG